MRDLDIYFNSDYGNLCTYVEPGEFISFEFSSEAGCIKNMFIKRPVPWVINGVQYYDIITPYGYGGPIVQEEKN